MDKKQLSLFPELDLKSNEPIVHDGSSGKFINKFVEKEKGPFESTLDNIQGKKLNKAEKQIVKVARQPDSRGMFKKLVKEDEAQYKKSQIRKETMPERIDRMIYQYDSPAVRIRAGAPQIIKQFLVFCHFRKLERYTNEVHTKYVSRKFCSAFVVY